MFGVKQLFSLVILVASCASDPTHPNAATDAGRVKDASSHAGSQGCGGAACGSGGAPQPGRGGTAGRGAGGTSAIVPSDTGTPGSYQPCPATGLCKVMPLGDSITYGQNTADDGGYREQLFHLTHRDGKALTFVGTQQDGPATVDGVPFPRDHEGYPGFTISDATDSQGDDHQGISERVGASLKATNPNIVLLMIGTNDVRFDIDLGHAPDRLGTLMDTILSYDSRILLVVAQITPTAIDATNAAVMTYNAAIPRLVSQRASAGKHLAVVDMYSAIASNANYKNDLLDDQVHPTVAGYQLLAAAWYTVLAPLLH
jgi:lysophospholipase L1-like esterase